MKANFQDVAELLATTHGGFTLWLGAGAAIAATRGATPSWSRLVDDICASHSLKRPDAPGDFPLQLELLSQQLGHRAFRRELRARLVDAVTPASLDEDILAHLAVIGARAGALVSYNIEITTAIPLVLLRGNAFLPRTFLEQSGFAPKATFQITSGIVCPPVYFPHGLLLQGNVVMTRSEYSRHMASIAMETAVHLAIGSHLVIIGMSLGDPYLRDALLRHRRWLHNVYWLNEDFEYREWARVAHVTCVEVPHHRVWPELAAQIVASDTAGKLADALPKLRAQFPALFSKMATWSAQRQPALDAHGATLVGIAAMPAEQIVQFAEYCLDMGFDVPPLVAADPRCVL